MSAMQEFAQFYASGEIVKADRKSVERAFEIAEDTLGLTHKKYDFSVFSIPEIDRYGEAIGAVNSYRGMIALPEYSHEALILHEATHIVAANRDRSFRLKPNCRTFYEGLVNETIAEGVAGLKFGYDLSVPFFLNFNRFKTSFIKNREKAADKAVTISRTDLPLGFTLAHRILECNYGEGRKDREVIGEILSNSRLKMENNLDGWGRDLNNSIVSMLSIWNAMEIKYRNLDFKDMANSTGELIGAGKCPWEVYFNAISTPIFSLPKLRKGAEQTTTVLMGSPYNINFISTPEGMFLPQPRTH